MRKQFDAINRLMDVRHIRLRSKPLLVGAGRVARAFAYLAAFHGVSWFRFADPDWVSQRNFAGNGIPESAVGVPKVAQLCDDLTRISNRISVEGAPVQITANNLLPDPLPRWLDECTDVMLFIDDFSVSAALARRLYGWRRCLYAGLTDGGLTGLAAFSLPGQTPCLDCSAALSRRRGGQGGETLLVDTFDVVSVAFRMFLGLMLCEGRVGFERFAPFVHPRFCLALIVNGPNGSFPLAGGRLNIPSGTQPVEVIDERGRGPSCPTCQGYAP